MDHSRYIELISASLDGELTARERNELDSHLAVCPECAALLHTLSANTEALRKLDCEVPADLKQRIMAGLPPQQSAKQGRILRLKHWLPLAAAACLVLATVVLAPRLGIDALDNAAAPAAQSYGVLRSSEAASADAPEAPEARDPSESAVSNGSTTAVPAVPGNVSTGHAYGGEPDRYVLENRQTIAVSYGSTPAPGATIIGSADALEAYLSQFGAVEYNEEDDPLPIAELEELRAAYDEEFFRTHRLLCVVVEASSGSIRYELDPQGLSHDTVTVRMHIPEVGTCDMAAWLLTAEVDAMWEYDCVLDVSFVR